MVEPTFREMIELRRFVDVLYDHQKVRKSTVSRMRLFPKETYNLLVDPLLKAEEMLTNKIEGALAKFPIYTDYLYYIKGMGPRLSGSLIAQIEIKFVLIDGEEYKELKKQLEKSRETGESFESQYLPEQIELAHKTENEDYMIPIRRGIKAFDNISKLWAFFGLAPEQKLRKGEKAGYSPSRRSLAWKIGNQQVIQGDYYRMVYDQKKIIYTAQRLPLGTCIHYDKCLSELTKRKKPACVGHIHRMSRHYATKRLFAQLWLKWREQEGLPITKPYSIEKLGHKTYYPPPDFKEMVDKKPSEC